MAVCASIPLTRAYFHQYCASSAISSVSLADHSINIHGTLAARQKIQQICFSFFLSFFSSHLENKRTYKMMPLRITGDAPTYKPQKERSKYKTGLHCRLRGPRTQIPNRCKLVEHTAGLWMQPRAARIETNRGDEAKPSPSKTTATNKKREGRGRGRGRAGKDNPD
jgi:hypothetical protein